MLDSPTKKRIDDARQILVGKVPDPKSQVEQITMALIYKFMDDMDRESEAMGGKASFFVKGYAEIFLASASSRQSSRGGATEDLFRGPGKASLERGPAGALPRDIQERLPALPRPRDLATCSSRP